MERIIVWKMVNYKKIRFGSTLSIENLSNFIRPKFQFHTFQKWTTIPEKMRLKLITDPITNWFAFLFHFKRIFTNFIFSTSHENVWNADLKHFNSIAWIDRTLQPNEYNCNSDVQIVCFSVLRVIQLQK